MSLTKSADLAAAIRTLVRQSPEVKSVTSQTGRNDDGTDPYGPNRNEFFVALTPYDTWTRGRKKADLVEELSNRLRREIPGGFFSFTQPIIDNVTEAVTGSPADLAIIITGSDLGVLRCLGAQTLAVLRDTAAVLRKPLLVLGEHRRVILGGVIIRGSDNGGVVLDAQKRLARAITLPEGYRVDWGGKFENLARARRRLAFILPVTILVIFGLLFFTFGSATYAGLVLLNVPFSLVGCIVALYLRGINLSVSAAVGFISLFGVAVMSGVLVVSEINRRRADRRAPARDAVIGGALAQMRPVLMMIVVAMLGMVPAALATGVGSDVQRPLATVAVGGLLSTLVLTLVALPALYWMIECRSKESRR